MIGYKNVGETTAEFVNRVRLEYNIPETVKVGICGKLDPQAKGKMKILIGTDTKLMTAHMLSSKIYEFDIMAGISTNSDDIMGNVGQVRECFDTLSENKLKDYMNNDLVKTTQQKYHHISAYKIRKRPGPKRPLWYWYKEGCLVEDDIPSKKVTIFKVEFLNKSLVPINEYKLDVKQKLDTMTDRTTWNIDEIWNSWSEITSLTPLIKLSYRIHVSSGFYIRMISKTINTTFNIPVHISNINRIDIIEV